MTAQIPDTLILDGVTFDVVGVDGAGLPRPEDFAIDPRSLHSACWRGFVLELVCEGGRLLLAHLSVAERDEQPPRIRGARLTWPKEGATWRYEFRRRGVPFSGRILLGGDFIRERYLHMGIQSASSFRTVLELSFRRGHLQAQVDLSAEAATVREVVPEPWVLNAVMRAVRRLPEDYSPVDLASVAPRLAHWIDAPFTGGAVDPMSVPRSREELRLLLGDDVEE
jgi:hypothetical protein